MQIPKPTKKPKAKKKKSTKLKVTKVQDAVNKAIREHEEYCRVSDGRHEHAGGLTASHFFPVGGNSAFRFYPPNIHCQCLGHHGIHERKQDPFFYRRFMESHYPDQLLFMETHYFASIKYTQEVLQTILNYAKEGDLHGLTGYIEELILQ